MERNIDDDIFRQAVLDHAKVLGMDPVQDAQFLWLAEEALLAELPAEWQVYESDEGVPYYYNTVTGNNTWQNPLDGPYRKMFQKLKSSKSPSKQQRNARSREWGLFPGEERIVNQVEETRIERGRQLARELGMEEKECGNMG